MSLLTELRSRLARRAAYSRTLRELRAMPRETAIDLGLFPEDAAQMARAAVYGR